MNVNDGLRGVPGVVASPQASPIPKTEPQLQAVRPQDAAIVPDHTDVSPAASLAQRAMSVPDVRMDKVAAIQQAIANGTYQVSPADVADKLVRQMLDE